MPNDEQSDLFGAEPPQQSAEAATGVGGSRRETQPLAARMRPRRLAEVLAAVLRAARVREDEHRRSDRAGNQQPLRARERGHVERG
jgi:hypothetical protein